MHSALKRVSKFISIIITITIWFFIPLFIKEPYDLHILITIFINIMLATSLRLIMTTGQVSFAHAAFMGIGAYTSTLFIMKLGLSFWSSLLPVGVISAVIAILFGYPTLRIKGVYFFIASLGFTQILVFAFNYWEVPFGGVSGIRNIPRPTPLFLPGGFTINIVSHIGYYYLGLIFALITMGIMLRLEKCRVTKTFKAITNQDILAQSIGINLMRYKILAFTIGSIFASFGGSLYACYIRFICPETFNPMIGVEMLVHIMLGGVNSVFGPAVGAIIMTILSERVTRMAGFFEPMAYGLILMITLLFLPNGLVSLWNLILGFIRGVANPKGDTSKER
jgi:branched-chain amino acid transport system permease protein